MRKVLIALVLPMVANVIIVFAVTFGGLVALLGFLILCGVRP